MTNGGTIGGQRVDQIDGCEWLSARHTARRPLRFWACVMNPRTISDTVVFFSTNRMPVRLCIAVIAGSDVDDVQSANRHAVVGACGHARIHPTRSAAQQLYSPLASLSLLFCYN
jgi:hypothetical protein